MDVYSFSISQLGRTHILPKDLPKVEWGRDPILTPLEVSELNAKVKQPDYANGVRWTASKKPIYTPQQIDGIIDNVEATRPVYTPKNGWTVQPVSSMYDEFVGPNSSAARIFSSGKHQMSGEELNRKLKEMKYGSFAVRLSNPDQGKNSLYEIRLTADPAIVGYEAETIVTADFNGTRAASDDEIDYAIDRLSDVAGKFDINLAPYNSGKAFGDSGRSVPTFYLENGYQAVTSEIRSKKGVLGYASAGQVHIIMDRIRTFGDMEDGHFSVDTNKEPKALLRHVIYHEIGHHFQGINMSTNTAHEDYDHREHVSKYGKESPAEHFAESFAKYMETGQASSKFMQFLRGRGLLKSQQND
jgi:hypothetical protein